MDYQSYSSQPGQSGRRSQKMETAAFVLGLIAAATICMVYPALICGSLAVMFALLSRGGELTFSPRAKAGLALGIMGLVIVLLMFAYTILVANLYYGGIEEMLREVYGSMGIDYDTFLQTFY